MLARVDWRRQLVAEERGQVAGAAGGRVGRDSRGRAGVAGVCARVGDAAQRAADLAALGGARAMQAAYPRLFEPALIDGRPNPRHLEKSAYLALGRAAAESVARENHAAVARVSFPDAETFAPVRVRVVVERRLRIAGHVVPMPAHATAELGPSPGTGPAAFASGGGYEGPLAYRQGKPMRPDVALAFDRMAEAARKDGVHLTISSGFRSDAEQAILFARRPTASGSRRPAHRCIAWPPSSTSARRAPTAGWRRTRAGSTSRSAPRGNPGSTRRVNAIRRSRSGT
jgi:hypothetical protein